MTDTPLVKTSTVPRPIRWWPAVVILLLAILTILGIHTLTPWPFQRRNLASFAVASGATTLLFLWWVTVSRAPWKLRLGVALAFLGIGCLMAGLFRIRGVSGDLIPILEPRWVRHEAEAVGAATSVPKALVESTNPGVATLSFPQFLGPERNATITQFAIDPDWKAKPPQVLWRQPVGAAWSGFAILGNRAVTQEQRGEEECVNCYETLTGRLLWSHADPARYQTTIAGEGPRCTPTLSSNRVYTLGATGLLNCCDLATGQKLWSRNIDTDSKARAPEWGFSGSPLVFDGKVVVSAGGSPDLSLLAYRATDGELGWSGGSASANYGSPYLTALSGVRQILVFNSKRIHAHDPDMGRVLWEYPWGNGQPQVAVPVVVGTNRVLFSSGYGVGSELLEIQARPDGGLTATRIWQSKRMKAKFANLVQRDGFLYGLDDGMFACLDLKDGSQKWKEGRYGHGQGLLVRDLFLLMAEDGELVLLRPTPEGPGELHRFRVFGSKTWNPIALAGDLLLVRNDQEAACIRLCLSAP
jgi:outer membrane protein assembly factor BamB